MGVRGYFLKKWKLCMQNLTKVERKQPPVVILQQSIFYNTFVRCLWLRIIRRSDRGVQFMNFSSQMFFNDINYGYRADILKKSFYGCFRLIWLWLLITLMKRCAGRCALELYRTSLNHLCPREAQCNPVFLLIMVLCGLSYI